MRNEQSHEAVGPFVAGTFLGLLVGTAVTIALSRTTRRAAAAIADKVTRKTGWGVSDHPRFEILEQ